MERCGSELKIPLELLGFFLGPSWASFLEKEMVYGLGVGAVETGAHTQGLWSQGAACCDTELVQTPGKCHCFAVKQSACAGPPRSAMA